MSGQRAVVVACQMLVGATPGLVLVLGGAGLVLAALWLLDS